jgi:hypothetical protein
VQFAIDEDDHRFLAPPFSSRALGSGEFAFRFRHGSAGLRQIPVALGAFLESAFLNSR